MVINFFLFSLGSKLSYSVAPKKTLNLINTNSYNNKDGVKLSAKNIKGSKENETTELSSGIHPFTNKSRYICEYTILAMLLMIYF